MNVLPDLSFFTRSGLGHDDCGLNSGGSSSDRRPIGCQFGIEGFSAGSLGRGLRVGICGADRGAEILLSP